MTSTASTTGDRAIVVGGGVAGLCAAHALRAQGWRVTVIDSGTETCSRQAGGMLAPVAELDHAESDIALAGLDAVERWQALLGDRAPGVLRADGSVLVAFRPEWPLLDQLADRVARAGFGARLTALDRHGLAEAEPALSGRFVRGWLAGGEGAIDPVAGLLALRGRGEDAGIAWETAHVDAVGAGQVSVDGAVRRAELVVDARGLGARRDVLVRGVRGEFAEVVAPEVDLRRPVRVLHPRHPLYVVPRGEGRFYVGATELERDDLDPPTVRSMLDLLSVLYALHPGFADASILRQDVGRRPTRVDHAPQVAHAPGIVRVNGLFRHGWLLGPILGEAVAAVAVGAPVPAPVAPFVAAEAA